MSGVRKQREPFSMKFVARSTQRSRLQKLTRFLECPELELSTNLAENSMRPVALGRKNWIHIGSPQAGPKVAAILSVVESCRRLKVPVRGYFSAILPRLADLPIRCLPDLTPAVWLARHSRTQATGVQREGGFATTTA